MLLIENLKVLLKTQLQIIRKVHSISHVIFIKQLVLSAKKIAPHLLIFELFSHPLTLKNTFTHLYRNRNLNINIKISDN